MTWKNDGHGIVFRPSEAKLYRPSHTWAMKLSQLDRQSGVVRIATYTLPEPDYVVRLLERRPSNIFLVVGVTKRDQVNRKRATAIKAALPGIRVAIRPETHTKLVLIAPRTIYVGSANFGRSGWEEVTLGVRSKEAHDWYVKNAFEPLWETSEEIA